MLFTTKHQTKFITYIEKLLASKNRVLGNKEEILRYGYFSVGRNNRFAVYETPDRVLRFNIISVDSEAPDIGNLTTNEITAKVINPSIILTFDGVIKFTQK